MGGVLFAYTGTRDKTGQNRELLGFGRFRPPRFGRFPGDLTPSFGRQRFGSGGTTGFATLPSDGRKLFRREVLSPCATTLSTTELAKSDSVWVLLSGGHESYCTGCDGV